MSASNAEPLAHAFVGWGKDDPANMRDVLHPAPRESRTSGPKREKRA